MTNKTRAENFARTIIEQFGVTDQAGINAVNFAARKFVEQSELANSYKGELETMYGKNERG